MIHEMELIISVVSYGNDFLSNNALSSYMPKYLDNPRYYDKIKKEEKVVSVNTYQWYQYLKDNGCKRI